jgi:drug/metabolite transporter (DMT)-like permease
MINSQSILLALFVAFLWGSTPILMRYCSKTLHFTTVMAISGLFYICFLGMLIYYQRKTILDDIKSNITLKTAFYMMCSAFMGIFLANLLFHQLIASNEVYITALAYTAPLFSVLIAYLLLGESICFRQIIGILLIAIGIAFVIVH